MISIIHSLLLSLFLFTPLIFTSFNSELFEIPKMFFVYGVTVILFTLHLLNSLLNRYPLFRRHFLTIPFGLFLLSQTISTLLSIDTHTSIYGYYSRPFGGLLSTLTCFILFHLVYLYLTDRLKQQIIICSLTNGFIVSLYAIAQHFGLNKSWWVQDVQARVFSTFGQPNWLAAYLCILMPLSLSQSLLALNNNRLSLFTVHSSLFTIYALSLLYTKSQTGIIAAFVSLGLYALTLLFTKSFPKLLTLPFTLLILLFCLTPNPLFSRIIPKSSPSTNNRQQPTTLNITPSENIRQIVWQGAWQLAQKYPLFGTGTETFAYSYYWTRPALHNLTSEWDFLYNKAHNEYLNLAATTGLFGLTSYLFLILSSLFFILKHLISDHQSPITDHLNPALLAGFISILITNFTGFSVVVIGLFLFLLPLLATSAPIPTTPTSPPTSSFRYVLAALILFFGFKSLITVVNHYSADYFFAQAEKFENRSNLTPALQSIQLSLQLKPQEPIYLIRAASITAKQAASLAQENKNSPNLPNLTNSVLNLTHQALSISPANTNLWKEQAQIFYYLSAVDLNYYLQAIDSLHKVVLLAPTDAKTYFTLGRFYQSLNRLDEAIKYYRLALDLKSNYDHASFALGEIYYTQKNYPQAQSYFEQTLKTAPANTSAQSYLEKINSYTSDP